MALYFSLFLPFPVESQDFENTIHMAQIIKLFQTLLILILHDYISAEDGETRASKS